MKICFRTIGSALLGGGHVMRCLAFAEALARHGHDLLFLVNEDALTAAPALAKSDVAASVVEQHAEAAVQKIMDIWPDGADWVIIDDYAIDATAEREIRTAARQIMVIDDLADRPHDCDILLDQTFGRRPEDYWGLAPRRAVMLLGSHYAILRPEFSAARAEALASRRKMDPVRRILISLGLTDVGGVTAEAARAVLAADVGAIIDVAVSSRAQSLPDLKKLAAHHPEIVVHVDSDDMCGLMAKADLAIGAGGTTTWERCCLGLPSIVIILADNQQETAANLQAREACRPLDARGGLAKEECVLLIRQLAGSAIERLEMAEACAKLCDGDGLPRVIAALESRQENELRLRPASVDDALDVLSWRNDPKARQYSIDQRIISLEDHQRWFSKVLASSTQEIWIAFDKLGKVGMIRLDGIAGISALRVSIAIDPARQGQGLAKLALAEARRSARQPASLWRAEIHEQNIASRRVFESCGYKCVGPSDHAGFLVYEQIHRMQG